MRKIDMVTSDRLKELLEYNSITGKFYWKIKPRPQTKPRDIAGCLNNSGYIVIRVDKVLYLAHRLAWIYHYQEMPEFEIDHIDGNPANNSILNLRKCTRAENCRNTKIKCNASSNYKGIYFDKRRLLWIAEIRTDKGKKYLGQFSCEHVAGLAYQIASINYHGDFSRQNIIH